MRHDMEDMMHGSTTIGVATPAMDALSAQKVRTFGKRRKQGFTLLEMTIVVALLGVLSAVAIPNFLGLQDSAVKVAAKGTASALSTAFAVNYAAAYSGSPDATTYVESALLLPADFATIVSADLSGYVLTCPALEPAGEPTACTLDVNGDPLDEPAVFYAIATE